MNCQTCQNALNPDVAFCTRCGTPVSGGDRPGGAPSFPMATPQMATPQMANQPAPGYPFASPAVSPVESVNYYNAAQNPNTGYEAPRAAITVGAPRVLLLPEEEILYEATFTPYLLLPHLKSKLVLTNKRVVVEHPGTLFRVFPFGYLASTARWSSVENVGVASLMSSHHIMSGLVGLFGMMLFLLQLDTLKYVFGSWMIGIIIVSLLVITVFSFANAKLQGMMISTGSGDLAVVGRSHELSGLEHAANKTIDLLLHFEKNRTIQSAK